MRATYFFFLVVVFNVMTNILAKLEETVKWKIVEDVYSHLVSDCILFITCDSSSAVGVFRGLSGISVLSIATGCSKTVNGIPSTMTDCSRPLFVVNDDLINHDRIIQILSWPRGNWNPTWLLFNPMPNKSLFARTPLWFDYLVLWVDSVKQSPDVKLIETYRVSLVLPIRQNIYAIWSQERSLQLKTRLRKNLEGIMLIGAVFESKPLVVIDHDNETDQVILGGYFGGIADVLMERLNFRMSLTEYSGPTKNKALLLLNSGEIDILPCALEMAAERIQHYTFTATLVYSTLEFFLRKRKSIDDVSWWNYLEPLPLNMWLGILGIFLLVCFLSCFTGKHLDWIEQAIYFLSIIYCQQGYPGPVESISSRIILFTCLLFGVVIYASYGGVIISNLAIEKTNFPFLNMKEIAMQRTYSLGTYLGSKVFDEFKEAKSGVLRDLYLNVMEDAKLPMTTKEAYNRVCNQNYIHIDYHEIKHYLSIASCQIVTLPEYYVRSTSTMGLPKHSPYKTGINRVIYKMTEFGILKKLMPKKQVEIHDAEFNEVTLGQIKFPLVLYSLGLFLSIILVFCECLFYNYDKRRKYKK